MQPQPYNISRAEVLQRFDATNAVLYLVSKVRDGTIWFPFQRYYRGDPTVLFRNLRNINLAVEIGDFRLYSYYPKYNSFMPAMFRGKPTVIAGTRNTYLDADVLSDFFIEHIRLKARRNDQDKSILECWMDDTCLTTLMKHVLENDLITPMSIRETIYRTIPETKVFNPTWARACVKLVFASNSGKIDGKKMLDISAGWGDRLLAAMSLDMEYLGYDPNTELQEGHTSMIEMFGDANKHRVIYEPFETAIIPNGPYDIVLSSPPYFNVEEYAKGQNGQSIVSYPTYDEWMANFLFAALWKAWEQLKNNGYLVLHLGDPNKQTANIVLAEPTNIFIESYLPGASWEGLVGLRGESGYARPVWIWKKVGASDISNKWLPTQYNRADFYRPPNRRDNTGFTNGNLKQLSYKERSLYKTYPELYQAWFRHVVLLFAPSYKQKKLDIDILRNYTKVTKVPKVSTIDDLLIYSILEVLGIEATTGLLQEAAAKKFLPKDILQKISVPYYNIRATNCVNIRQHVQVSLPSVSMLEIEKILDDDLIISTMLECITIDATIVWAVDMVSKAYR